MSQQPPPYAGPRIPSNVRIRRGRSNSTSAMLAEFTNRRRANEEAEQREAAQAGRNTIGATGGRAGETATGTAATANALSGTASAPQRPQLGSMGRHRSSRAVGAVEALAMNDRIAARTAHVIDYARRPSSAGSTSSDGHESSSAASGPGVSGLPSSASAPGGAAGSPSRSTTGRPRAFTKVSESVGPRLPALTEVTSPIEGPSSFSDALPSSRRAANVGQSHGTGETEGATDTQDTAVADPAAGSGIESNDRSHRGYFGAENTKGSPTHPMRPGLAERHTTPPEPTEPIAPGTQIPVSNSVDDSIAQLEKGGRLARIPSNVSIPTPLTEVSETSDPDHHAAEVADYLDVIDAEVGALSYLTNVQNSIFVPNIPMLYDRRPVHDLPGSRRRGYSIASMARRRPRSSTADSQSRASQDRASIASTDLEHGRPSAPGGETGFTGGEKTGRIASRRSVLTRMTSAVGLGPKEKEEEEEDPELRKHIKQWRDMDEDERDELDEHVRLVLSKKSKFHRGAKGFYAFVKTPMGFIMTLYGFLITFWGTAIMLFIFGWIHVGERKRYWIEICDQILCALFAAVGLGFAPFRAVDTYRMIWITKMHYRTWERRQMLGLTDLNDKNDLPRPEGDGSNQVSRLATAERSANATPRDTPMETTESPPSTVGKSVGKPKHWWDFHRHQQTPADDLELLAHEATRNSAHRMHKDKSSKLREEFVVPERAEEEEDPTGKTGDLKKQRENRAAPPLKRNDSIKSELVKDREDIVVLTKEEQALLEHHQRKFHQSHTFYRFHETATHRAFPLDIMVAIVCLLDCHSLIQGALGGCTWGIKYTHRPTVLTATLITCSLSCNAAAGLLIYIGGRKTKKREEVERRLKIALEAMALAKIERRRARGELPARAHDGNSVPEEGNSAGDSSDRSEDEKNQAELRRAVDTAAKETQEEDQAPYDDDEKPARAHRA